MRGPLGPVFSARIGERVADSFGAIGWMDWPDAPSQLRRPDAEPSALASARVRFRLITLRNRRQAGQLVLPTLMVGINKGGQAAVGEAQTGACRLGQEVDLNCR